MPIKTWIGNNAIAHALTRFPGGELGVRIDYPRVPYGQRDIEARLQTPEDVIELLLLTDALRSYSDVPIELWMPYVPYARQDRRTALGEAFSLKVFAQLINAQNYSRVHVFDPHSDVVGALFDEVRIMDNGDFVHLAIIGRYEGGDIYNGKKIGGHLYDYLGYAGGNNTAFHLVAPDAGAAKKTEKLVRHMPKWWGGSLVQAGKVRDTQTGKLSGFTVFADDLGGRPCLIVDDICDGGGTFNLLAEAWKRDPMSKDCQLDMWVSHGIFSKGLNAIDPVIRQIWTTDSWCDARQMSERLTVVPLLPHFLKFAGFPNA
jgi:ribose-phosphate pyrophosphokinase